MGRPLYFKKSSTLSQEDCTRLTLLVRLSSVGRAPTSATEPSVQLDLESWTSCRRTSDSWTLSYSRFTHTVAEDVLFGQRNQKRSVNAPFNFALEILLKLVTYLVARRRNAWRENSVILSVT